MISSILVLLLVALVTLAGYRRYRKVQLLEKIPGPKSLPLLGNALDVSGSHSHLFETFNKFCCEYGRGMCRIYLGLQPYVFLSKAKYVEAILSSNQLLEKSGDYHFLHPWLGTGLLTSTALKWRSRRKLLTPAFHFKILDDFIEVFHNQSLKLVRKFDTLSGQGEVDISNHVTLCTLDVIIEAAMGIESNFQNELKNDYLDAMSKIRELLQSRSVIPWLQYDFLFNLLGYGKQQNNILKVLHGLSLSTIRKRREEFRKQKLLKKEDQEQVIGVKKRLAFLDLLLEQSERPENQLTDEDLREEVDTFMFEGHDTTAAGITFTLYWLARHPEIQERVFQEVNDVLGSDEVITAAHVRDFKYLECCIKESLRLCPSVPFTGRILPQDTVIEDHVIPKGTYIFVMYYTLHRDPEYFPNPEKFDPDRFLPEGTANRHPYSYVPFSAGPRNCIGQKFALNEEKVVIANVIRKHRLSTKQTLEDMGLQGELVLGTENGVLVATEKRD